MECPECGSLIEEAPLAVCNECWGPLQVKQDYETVKDSLKKREIKNREQSLWRYLELLPIKESRFIVNLGDGWTPLTRCQRLERELGVKELYIKNDALNPTGSFKDRPASVGVSKALEFGFNVVGCASTGNLAAATAAHAAKAGVKSFVLIPGNIEPNKVVQSAAYGAKILQVEGTYDAANRLGILASEIFNWALLNINLRPFYVEGSKTLAYEICEQLDWNTPDRVIIPMGSGALLNSFYRGLADLEKIDFIDNSKDVKITGAQPKGCSPIVDAFHTNNRISPVKEPKTICKSLAIGEPASGKQAIKVIRETGGYADAPSDEEIIEAEKILASREGIFAEPAGAITLATLIRLIDNGVVEGDEKIVLLVTGSGFKSLEAAQKTVGKPVKIPANIDALREAVENG